MKYGIQFIFSRFYEYSNLDVHIHVIYRVNQAEYAIRILVVASQEYVNTYSTRRVLGGGVPRGKHKGGEVCSAERGIFAHSRGKQG